MNARNEVEAAQVEVAFRSTNARHPNPRLLGYLCECTDEDCHASVHLSGDQYKAIRMNPRRFFVIRGHERAPEVEVVIERHDDYVVVEKRGEAARVAEESQP